MALPTYIKDGEGNGYAAGVTPESALKVAIIERQYSGLLAAGDVAALTAKKLYQDFLRDSNGSRSMKVDGSSTAVQFSAEAENSKVKWITAVRIILNSTYMELNTNDFRRFGAAAAAPGLTNGILLYVEQGGVRTDIFYDAVKYAGQFLDYATEFTNLANAITAQSDYLSVDFRLETAVVLPAGSHDKIIAVVQDNLTALDAMEILVRGWQEYLG